MTNMQQLRDAADNLINTAQAIFDENERRRNLTLAEWLAENMAKHAVLVAAEGLPTAEIKSRGSTMKKYEYPELKPDCPVAPMCNCTGGCERKTEELPMENTRALEVAEHFVFLRNKVARDEITTGEFKRIMAEQIQAAIDEATKAERAMCDRLAEALGKAIHEIEGWIEYAPEEAEYSEWVLVAIKPQLAAYTAHKEGR